MEPDKPKTENFWLTFCLNIYIYIFGDKSQTVFGLMGEKGLLKSKYNQEKNEPMPISRLVSLRHFNTAACHLVACLVLIWKNSRLSHGSLSFSGA